MGALQSAKKTVKEKGLAPRLQPRLKLVAVTAVKKIQRPKSGLLLYHHLELSAITREREGKKEKRMVSLLQFLQITAIASVFEKVISSQGGTLLMKKRQRSISNATPGGNIGKSTRSVFSSLVKNSGLVLIPSQQIQNCQSHPRVRKECRWNRQLPLTYCQRICQNYLFSRKFFLLIYIPCHSATRGFECS